MGDANRTNGGPERNPYYVDEGVTIHHGDCLDVLPSLPKRSVDLIVTDPPYNTSQSKSFENADGTTGFKGWTPIREGWDAMTTEDYRTFLAEVVGELHRVLAPNGSAYFNIGMGQMSFLGMELERQGFYLLNVIAWYQPNKFPQNYGKTRFNPATEVMFYVRKGRSHYFNYTGFLRDCWEIDAVPASERLHPAQKPLSLYERCIEHSCPPKGVVLDPFMGSGTTLRAAKNLGRIGVGIERDESYCDVAVRRLAQEALAI